MKLIKRLALLLIVVVLLLFGAGWMLVTPASRAAVEQGGRYALGVETSLEDVEFSPGVSRSVLGFSGLKIGNPEGIAGEPFLEVGDFSLGLRTFSLMSNQVRVPEVELDGLHLRLIQDGQRSNFGEILAHLRGLGGAEQATDPAPATSEGAGSPGPTLALGRLGVKGVQASLELRGVPGLEPFTRSFTLPDFELDLAQALGAGGGADDGSGQGSVGAITAALVDELITLGVAEAKQHVGPKVAAILDGNLKAALEAQLEQEKDELIDEAGKKLNQELEGQLKGLLGDG